MKVAMVGPYPEPGQAITGGVERVIDTLLRELGPQVDLTLVVPDAASPGEAVNHGVRTLYLKRAPGPGALRYWTADAWRLARTIEAQQPDLVHLQGAAGAGLFLTSPSILTVHGIVDRDMLASARGSAWGPMVRQGLARLLRSVEARARARIGNIIVISPYVVEAQPDIGGLRQFAVPNPIDAAFCSPRPVSMGRRRNLIAVGSIGPRKNTLEILRAAAQVMARDPEVRLSLCGAPADRDYYQACVALIRQQGIADRVDLPGNLATPELIDTLDAAACLVMASRQETSPMAIAEANARGVAVVAPEAFGIRHMITPGRNGYFLPAGDLEAQARALHRALHQDWDRAAIAEEARRTYAPARISSLTLAAYRDVLARGPSRARRQAQVASASSSMR